MKCQVQVHNHNFTDMIRRKYPLLVEMKTLGMCVYNNDYHNNINNLNDNNTDNINE